jgi:tetratricopeptide (TPR) repeat protein
MERELQSLGVQMLQGICLQLKLDPNTLGPEDLPRLAGRLSEMIRICGGHQKANRVYQEIKQLADLDRLAEVARSEDSRLGIFEDLARASLFAGDYDKAKFYFKKVLHNAEVKRDRSGMAKYLNWLGFLERSKSNYDGAMIHFERARQQAEAAKDNAQLSKAHYNMGDVHWFKGEFDEALLSYERAIGIAQDQASKGAAHVGIANVNMSRHFLDEAEFHYREALRLLESTDDYLDIARAYNNLGDVYLQLERWAEALDCFTKGEVAGDKGGWLNIKAFTMFNSAVALIHQGKSKTAREYLDRSMKILNVIDSKPGLAGAHYAYGQLYMVQKAWGKMAEHFQLAIDLYAQSKVPFYVAQTRLDLGRGYIEKGDMAEAKEQLEEAARIYEQIKLPDMAMKARALIEES